VLLQLLVHSRGGGCHSTFAFGFGSPDERSISATSLQSLKRCGPARTHARTQAWRHGGKPAAQAARQPGSQAARQPGRQADRQTDRPCSRQPVNRYDPIADCRERAQAEQRLRWSGRQAPVLPGCDGWTTPVRTGTAARVEHRGDDTNQWAYARQCSLARDDLRGRGAGAQGCLHRSHGLRTHVTSLGSHHRRRDWADATQCAAGRGMYSHVQAPVAHMSCGAPTRTVGLV
jgi:hypothetical protein